ncbi:MAG: DUF4743 domain-containing protein [Alphaproteobacteria bacterium]
MSFLDRIAACNRWRADGLRPFVVAGWRVGMVGDAFAERLARFAGIFEVDGECVTLDDGLGGFEPRSRALATVLRELGEDGEIKGWRGELYPVAVGFSAPPLLAMERAAIPRFGVRAYGVHMNGFVGEGENIEMWIGRRAEDKQTFPGKLDNIVAGGQPIGIGLMENLIKEAGEEASIPPELAARARPVGAISYCALSDEGLKPDTQFCYDLRLPADFVPQNADGEIASFELWPIEKVMQSVAETEDFKFNCNLVIIDFLIRHGLIAPDRPDYLAIAGGLRRPHFMLEGDQQ